MNDELFVIDASIAIKWVVDEEQTPEALALRRKGRLIAPELLVAECANILWKKVRRGELSEEEALLAARLIQGSDVELTPMRSLIAVATGLAIELGHPAYDCIYLAAALETDCRFVTADAGFLMRLSSAPRSTLQRYAVSLGDLGRQ